MPGTFPRPLDEVPRPHGAALVALDQIGVDGEGHRFTGGDRAQGDEVAGQAGFRAHPLACHRVVGQGIEPGGGQRGAVAVRVENVVDHTGYRRRRQLQARLANIEQCGMFGLADRIERTVVIQLGQHIVVAQQLVIELQRAAFQGLDVDAVNGDVQRFSGADIAMGDGAQWQVGQVRGEIRQGAEPEQFDRLTGLERGIEQDFDARVWQVRIECPLRGVFGDWRLEALEFADDADELPFGMKFGRAIGFLEAVRQHHLGLGQASQQRIVDRYFKDGRKALQDLARQFLVDRCPFHRRAFELEEDGVAHREKLFVHGNDLPGALGIAQLVEIQHIVQRFLEQWRLRARRVDADHHPLGGTPVFGAVVDLVVEFEHHRQPGAVRVPRVTDRGLVDMNDDRRFAVGLILGQGRVEHENAAPAQADHIAGANVRVEVNPDVDAIGHVVLIDATLENLAGNVHDQLGVARRVVVILAAGAGEFDQHLHHFGGLGRLAQTGHGVGDIDVAGKDVPCLHEHPQFRVDL
ncbi:hypothetical protein D3C84_532780 [compost metagenome]